MACVLISSERRLVLCKIGQASFVFKVKLCSCTKNTGCLNLVSPENGRMSDSFNNTDVASESSFQLLAVSVLHISPQLWTQAFACSFLLSGSLRPPKNEQQSPPAGDENGSTACQRLEGRRENRLWKCKKSKK